MMKELLTPKQVARAIGVSEASLKRWCDKGIIHAIRTAGGHRRLPVNSVMQFIRSSGRDIVDPGVLGLPTATGTSEHSYGRIRGLFRVALEAGNQEHARRLIFNLYASGKSVYEICDRVMAPAFYDIGDNWSHGKTEVYQERRGVELTLRILHELRMMLPEPAPHAPTAIGGTMVQDPYSIPTNMVELALREMGWRAQSLGSGHPIETLCEAARLERPRLFWLNVSTVLDRESFIADYRQLRETLENLDIPLVVGGRALAIDQSLRADLQYTCYCDQLAHLVTFARTLYHPKTLREQGRSGG